MEKRVDEHKAFWGEGVLCGLKDGGWGCLSKSTECRPAMYSLEEALGRGIAGNSELGVE